MRLFLLMLYFLFLESCTTVEVTKEIIKAGNAVKNNVSEIVSDKKDESIINEDKGIQGENTPETAAEIEDEIKDTIDNYEPRVKLRSVRAVPDFEGNAFDVVITYDIIGIDASPQQLAFALQSTR